MWARESGGRSWMREWLWIAGADVDAPVRGTSAPFYNLRGEHLHKGKRKAHGGRAIPNPCLPILMVGLVDLS